MEITEVLKRVQESSEHMGCCKLHSSAWAKHQLPGNTRVTPSVPLVVP